MPKHKCVTLIQPFNVRKMILIWLILEKWWLSGQNMIMASSSAPWSNDSIEKQVIDYTNSLFQGEWPNGEYYNWMDAIYGNYTVTSAQK